MRFRELHSWNVTPGEAVEIQRDLRGRIRARGAPKSFRTVAGADIAVDRERETAYSGVIVYRFPEMEEVERRTAERRITFPYVPGLLAFREAPALLEAFSRLEASPDVILFDGHGLAHPRRMGIASHMGLLLDRPTIGCGKSRLVGEYPEPKMEKGSRSPLIHRGEIVGAVVRTREGVRPVFVSAGHRIDLETAVAVTLRCTDGYRIPKPTREADRLVGEAKREGNPPARS